MAFPVPSPYKWDASFDVKHGELNEQHKKLFDLIDRLDKDKSNKQVLNDLLALVKLHFSTEESVRQGKGLLSDGHKAKHVKLVEDVGKLPAIDQAATDFLKNWLVNHIKASDIPDYAGKV